MNKKIEYQPSKKILENYAKVLVNYALNSGKGVQKGETVYLTCNEYAKPIYVELRAAILRAGGNVISNYLPDDDETANKNFNISKAQLPKILSNDPALPEGCQSGDVVRIERRDGDKINFYCRVVV